MATKWSIQIAVDLTGVRAVRVLGNGWELPDAYNLLSKLSPVVQELDLIAKGEGPGAQQDAGSEVNQS